jgi:hypothetical protein
MVFRLALPENCSVGVCLRWSDVLGSGYGEGASTLSEYIVVVVFQARLSALRFPCFARSPGQSVLGLLVRRDDGSLDYHLNPPRLWQAVRRGEVGIHEALLRAAERPSACKRSGWEMIHWVSFSLSGSVCCVLLQASNIMHALLGAALVALINLSPNVHVRAFAALRVFTGQSIYIVMPFHPISLSDINFQ